MLQDLSNIIRIVQEQLDQIFDKSFITSSWKGSYCRVAHMASDSNTAALLYVDHPRLSCFFGSSFPCSKHLNLLLQHGLSCCWWAEWFNYFSALSLLHCLTCCDLQKSVFIYCRLTKHYQSILIFSIFYMWESETLAEEMLSVVTKRRFWSPMEIEISLTSGLTLVCWKKMTPSFVCARKGRALLLFNNSIFRICNCPQWLQLTDPDYCSLWSFLLAMILWLNLLSCASFRYIFCFFRFSVLETDIAWMKIGRKTWKASGFWVRWQNIREASGTPQMVGINCCGRTTLPGTPWSLFLK